MRYIQIILLIVFSWGVAGNLCAQQNNDVKYGTVEMKADFNFPVDSVRISLTLRNILTDEERTWLYKVPAQGQTNINVPVILKKTVGYLNVFDDSVSYFDGLVGLDQEVPLIVQMKGVDGQAVETYLSGGMGFNSRDAQNMLRAFVKFEEKRYLAPKDSYVDWRKYIQLEMDSLYAKRMSGALKDYALSTKARQWVTNVMTTYYLGGRVMSYQQDAQRYYKLTVPHPPLEYYSFLKRFDMNRIIMHSDIKGLVVFLRFFLYTPAFDIRPIGEQSVGEWTEEIKRRLTPTVGEMPDYLLGLLAAASYLQQLEQVDPLTEIQVEHIKGYYRNDMQKFLLNENDVLLKAIASKRESIVCTVPKNAGEALLESILKKYEGKPVVVDLWNIWCGPCQIAHRLVEPMKSKPEFSGIEFVYIVDESSTRGRWEGEIAEIGGYHYYLTEKEAAFLKVKVGYEGFPYYLFYDAQHELKGTSLGFPGPVEFLMRLRSLK